MSDFLNTILSRFCGKALTPVDFTALFRYILTYHFSHPDNIYDPSLKDLIYTEGRDTKIIIESSGVWNPEVGDHRPAILISRGEWKTAPLGLGSGRIQDTLPDTYVRRYIGSHNIICVGKTAAAADTLSGEVLHFLVNITPVVRSILPISGFNVEGLSKLQPFDEGRTHFAATIVVSYMFDLKWTIQTSPAP